MQITRDEVIARSYQWPEFSIPYSMVGLYNGYRRDCSGYVSYCLKLPAPGYSTVNLPDVCTKIPSSELQPGDLIGKMGPGTGGADGHVQLFIGWTTTGLSISEQAGGMNGPWHHDIKRIDPDYECYRYNDIVVQPPLPTPTEDDEMIALLVQDDTGMAVMWYDGSNAWYRGIPDNSDTTRTNLAKAGVTTFGDNNWAWDLTKLSPPRRISDFASVWQIPSGGGGSSAAKISGTFSGTSTPA